MNIDVQKIVVATILAWGVLFTAVITVGTWWLVGPLWLHVVFTAFGVSAVGVELLMFLDVVME